MLRSTSRVHRRAAFRTRYPVLGTLVWISVLNVAWYAMEVAAAGGALLGWHLATAVISLPISWGIALTILTVGATWRRD